MKNKNTNNIIPTDKSLIYTTTYWDGELAMTFIIETFLDTRDNTMIREIYGEDT